MTNLHWGGWWAVPEAASTGLALLACVPALAIIVDRLLGEPPVRWHPVVWMGQWLGWAGRRLAPQMGQPAVLSSRRIFWFAAATWCAGAATVFSVSWLIQRWVLTQPTWLAVLALGLFLKPLLSWAMLHDEVLGVERALMQSLGAGRAQLARLVSRDVSTLTASEVRESAVESLAENLNDSVVAPLFWFVLLGLPGAALFRFANTADAMWGYPGERGGRDWQWAGKWAARADDVLGWLPARITALLIVVLGGLRDWRPLFGQASRTPSPNSGWPMAAMALVLGVRLRKPGVYTLNDGGRVPEPTDTLRACAMGSRAVLGVTLMTCGVLLAVVV